MHSLGLKWGCHEKLAIFITLYTHVTHAFAGCKISHRGSQTPTHTHTERNRRKTNGVVIWKSPLVVARGMKFPGNLEEHARFFFIPRTRNSQECTNRSGPHTSQHPQRTTVERNECLIN
uniref:Putative secreted protein n=1 Tax=Anopheles marajoara TaxID=58244 RepID=A0A2M4C7G6_9DIPT